MKHKTKTIGIFLWAIMASCGNKKPIIKDQSLNGNSFKLVDKGNLAFTKNSVEGSGKLIFKNPLKSHDNSFTFSINLLDKSSSVEIVINANKNLNNGVSLKFSREKNALKVTATVKKKSIDISRKFKSLNSKDHHTFIVDHHNEDPSHIIIWEKGSEYTENNALFNSEKDSPMPGQANGKFWGLLLIKAKTQNPKASQAKLSHHHHHNHDDNHDH